MYLNQSYYAIFAPTNPPYILLPYRTDKPFEVQNKELISQNDSSIHAFKIVKNNC